MKKKVLEQKCKMENVHRFRLTLEQLKATCNSLNQSSINFPLAPRNFGSPMKKLCLIDCSPYRNAAYSPTNGWKYLAARY